MPQKISSQLSYAFSARARSAITLLPLSLRPSLRRLLRSAAAAVGVTSVTAAAAAAAPKHAKAACAGSHVAAPVAAAVAAAVAPPVAAAALGTQHCATSLPGTSASLQGSTTDLAVAQAVFSQCRQRSHEWALLHHLSSLGRSVWKGRQPDTPAARSSGICPVVLAAALRARGSPGIVEWSACTQWCQPQQLSVV